MSLHPDDLCAEPGLAGTSSRTAPPLLLRVEDVCAQLHLSRATVNRLLAAGVLPSVKLGRSRRIVHRQLEQFVDDLAAGRLSVDAQRLLSDAR